MEKRRYTSTHFQPLSASPKRHLIAAWDTEGNGSPEGFVCGSVVCNSGNYLFYTRRDMLEFLLSPQLRGHWIYAHNLEYDLGVLTGGNLLDFDITFTEHNILWAEVWDDHKHKRLFLDSTNLFPGVSVADLGNDCGLHKKDLHPVLISWLRNPTRLTDLDRDDRWRITEYCLRDSEIIFQSVSQLQEELNSLGGELKPTVSGCSMDLFRRRFMQRAWPIVDQDTNKLARQAYYGARTEPYRLGRVAEVNGYDYSSLYPSIMASADFPRPGCLTLEICPASFNHLLGKSGVASVTVRVPDDAVPPLPVRVDHKLFFPFGTFRGVWTLPELSNALNNGCEVLSCDWILFTSARFSPFTEFIEKLYALRVLHAQDSKIKERFFKALLNSAYGRYGLNPDTTLHKLVPLRSNQDFETYKGARFYQLRRWPYLLYPMPNDGQPAYANALIAAYISAGARIKMHGMLRDNLEGLCYTDTDSLFLDGEIPVSTGLGGIRKTHTLKDMWIVAPKEYAVFSGESLVEAHAKGVPTDYRLAYLQSGRVAFPQPNSIRDSVRRNLTPAEWCQRLKQRQYSWPKRSPVLDRPASQEYFETRPWSVEELRLALEQSRPEPRPV